MTTRIVPDAWQKQETLKDRKGHLVREVVMMQEDVVAKCIEAPIGSEVTMSNTNGDWLVRVIAAKPVADCLEGCLQAAEKIGGISR